MQHDARPQKLEVLERIDGQEQVRQHPAVDDHGAVEAREHVFDAPPPRLGVDTIGEDRVDAPGCRG